MLGMESKSKGHFRPNLLITNPKRRFPNKAPIPKRLAIHDALSSVILPDGSGDSSDVKSKIFGDGQPNVIP